MSPSAWTRTAVHHRALGVVLALAVLAVLGHRPDLVVLLAPFLAIAVWGHLARPDGTPSVHVDVTAATVSEGQRVQVVARCTGLDGADTVGHVLGAAPDVVVEPPAVLSPASTNLDEQFTVRPTRWGPTWVVDGDLIATSPWGAYQARCRPAGHIDLLVTPTRGAFEADAPVRSTSVLLGAHTAPRRGDGAEFDVIREFVPGDRPRHVHWPTTARTGRLHVRTTHAENDLDVTLLVDAFGTLPGEPDGSLTCTVRAAAAVADWFTRTGDRVGLRVLGARSVAVPARTGRGQLVRILSTLARIVPASDRMHDATRMTAAVAPSSLLVVLSPLTEPLLTTTAVARARAGQRVVVVDTAPEHVTAAEPVEQIAWRILQLERERTVAQLAREGVAVTSWRGPGSLDNALRGLARRGRR